MSKKRLQVILTDEAWSAVEALTQDANEKFDSGSINYSDVINEMVLSSKVDIKALQLKHTDLRRSLKALASKEDLDIELAIKSLMELKARGGTGKRKNNPSIEEA
jgi:hypothetical protein